MFTGIVEELGEVVRLERQGDGAALTVRGGIVASDAGHGDSIAVNGVCLTVVTVDSDAFTVDVMKETFDRSTLGDVKAGDPVNLERAATLATRLGGHLVQGHVDGVAEVLARTPGERWVDLRFSLPAELARYVVEKGSICVDGVSLTVTTVDDSGFGVGLIPTTLEQTTLGRKGVGELVNLEVDVVAKYVERLVGPGVRQ